MSAKASHYFDELARLEGRARDIASRRMNEESERLESLERRLAVTCTAIAALETQDADAEWVAQMPQNFARVWAMCWRA